MILVDQGGGAERKDKTLLITLMISCFEFSYHKRNVAACVGGGGPLEWGPGQIASFAPPPLLQLAHLHVALVKKDQRILRTALNQSFTPMLQNRNQLHPSTTEKCLQWGFSCVGKFHGESLMPRQY